MIQINAAQRLKVVAKANEAMARTYVESLGLDVRRGPSPLNETGKIWFYLNDEADDAVAAVTKKLGKPKVKAEGTKKMYQFKVGSGRYVVVCKGPGTVWVLLTDSADLPDENEVKKLKVVKTPKMPSRRLNYR